MKRLVSAIALACLAMPSMALAAGTLDQKQEASEGRLGSQFASHNIGQTFQAGITGDLDQLDLMIARYQTPGPLTVQIRATSGGLPTTTVLATEIVDGDALPPNGDFEFPTVFVSVPFDPAVAVTAGTLYAITVGPVAPAFPSGFFWGFARQDAYPAGRAVESFTGGASWQGASGADWDTTFRTYVTPANSAPDCSSVIASPSTLTSVTRKFSTITLAGATDPDGDAVTLQITSVTQDEPLTGKGDSTSPDAMTTPNPNQVQIRAEGDPKGDGRVYAIGFTVSDGNGETCSGTVTVSVPRKKGAPAVDSGQSYNSFGP